MFIGRGAHVGLPLSVGALMRRSLVIAGFVAPLCLLAGLAWPAEARGLQTPTGTTNAATCAFTNYVLNGTFNRIGGSASFTLGATGSCVGTSSSVVVNLVFSSVGPWSCVAGVATGSGVLQPNNGFPQSVGASLVNAGGEYVVELHGLTAAAAGQFTTLPIPCEEGQTQTTIGGTGTLTFFSS
jgi:hypothetical protein